MNLTSLKLTRDFSKKIVWIGFGCVGKCTLPLFLKMINVDPHQVTVIDKKPKDKDPELKKLMKLGVKFVQQTVDKNNYTQILSKYTEKDGLCIDLAYNIQTEDMLQWCYEHDVMFINTSVEEWDPFESMSDSPTIERTLYYRQYQIKDVVDKWEQNGATCVVDHGANPGLISHLTKHGLVSIAHKYLADTSVSQAQKIRIDRILKSRDFQRLPMELGVKVIHCSERDTQRSKNPKKVGEFVGTWSVEGLREEGMSPAELGWGTHEDEIPDHGQLPDCGNKNQIFLDAMGVNTFVRSMVPAPNGKDVFQIKGMVIRHGEAFSMSEYFTVWDESDVLVYRPTVHYAYQPCDNTCASLWEFEGSNYKHEGDDRIMYDGEIIDGEDILGALIMGHRYDSWWCGSILSIDEARKLCPGQNATSIQVACSFVAACKWMIANPRAGYNLPDALPYEFMIEQCMPYLGKFVCQEYDWTPLDKQTLFFDVDKEDNPLDKKNVWKFQNFLMKE